jgi:hypothetical protein
MKALRSDCVATRILIPFSTEKRRLFSDEQVRWMLRTVRHPLYELNLCVAIVVFYAYATLAWIVDPYEQRFGCLTLVLSLVMLPMQLSIASLLLLTLQVPILARSLLRFDFFFNLATIVVADICFAIVYRGSIWNKCYLGLMLTLILGGFTGFIHAVQLRLCILRVVLSGFACASRTLNLFYAATHSLPRLLAQVSPR